MKSDHGIGYAYYQAGKASGYERYQTTVKSALRVYGVGGQLLEGVRSFYENASASLRVNGELSESFKVEVGVRQRCVMSPWLFSIYMDGWVYKRNESQSIES